MAGEATKGFQEHEEKPLWSLSVPTWASLWQPHGSLARSLVSVNMTSNSKLCLSSPPKQACWGKDRIFPELTVL